MFIDQLFMYICCVEVVSPASSAKSAAIAKVSTSVANQEA